MSLICLVFYEAEAIFHEDLRKFYLDDDQNEGDLIVGSAAYAGIQFTENTKDARNQVVPLLDAIQGNLSRVQSEYQTIFSTFKVTNFPTILKHRRND
jgi:hypothetical protein